MTKLNFLLSGTFFLFKQKYILFLKTYFCKIPKNLIASGFFFLAEADTKKHIYVSTKASAFADCRDEFRTLRRVDCESLLLFNHGAI